MGDFDDIERRLIYHPAYMHIYTNIHTLVYAMIHDTLCLLKLNYRFLTSRAGRTSSFLRHRTHLSERSQYQSGIWTRLKPLLESRRLQPLLAEVHRQLKGNAAAPVPQSSVQNRQGPQPPQQNVQNRQGPPPCIYMALNLRHETLDSRLRMLASIIPQK
ncbi:hypothetical protein CI102_1794 [Trichoderma harzianum]|nr:hypothetical protein CI102_1794 [Trichoderma harzianum]